MDVRRPTVRHAFTLVELLVVIGVIALLISILLPALNKARQAGLRTVCLSNLRQQYTANVMYANDNKGAIPIGFNYRKGLGNMLWDSGSPVGSYPRYLQQGVLIESGHLKNPKFFFCPAEGDPQYMFDTPENPWTPVPSRWAIFAGYTSRPLADWTDNAATNKNMPLLYYAGHYPWLIGPKHMRLTWLRSGTALLADSFPDFASTRARHKSGLNVVYSDGSGRWIPEGVYGKQLSVVNDKFDTKFNSVFLDNDGEPNRSGIWIDFDRAR